MIIIMQPGCTPASVKAVSNRLAQLGYTVKPIIGVEKTIVCAVGGDEHKNVDALEQLRGYDEVEDVLLITKPYKIVAKEYAGGHSVVDVEGVPIGGEEIVVMAGPCTIESEEQVMVTAEAVARAGATIFRGGAYKPSTSPYSYQGMGKHGLEMMRDAGNRFGLRIITEVMDVRKIELVSEYADMLQVGCRNMQNYDLLKEIGLTRKPVMLKRGMSAKYEELLLAAEYIASNGNDRIVLCERGIRTFETYTRNTLDIGAVAVLRDLSHLPVIVDPSHGTGRRELVAPLSRAAIAAGADGLMIEVHPNPDKAIKDGPQSITLPQFQKMMPSLARVADAVERRLSLPVGA